MQNAKTRDSHSDILRGKISLVAPRMQEQLSRFWNHSQFEQVFLKHMEFLYHSISASVPLMEAALQRSQEISDSCPVAAILVPYLSKHIEEERGHDQWLLDDLELLGRSTADIQSQIPPTSVATQIGSQYYYINHVHPLAVIAFLAVIEGSPPEKEALDRVVASTNIPKEALRTFYKHSDIDRFHSQELWDLIDELPLLPWHHTLLGVDAMLVTEQNACIMETVLEGFD